MYLFTIYKCIVLKTVKLKVKTSSNLRKYTRVKQDFLYCLDKKF